MINDAGRQIIETFEGCRLKAYRCPAGRWTIGYGHTGDVLEGMEVTQHEAEVILEHDLDRFETGVVELCPGTNQNQRAALISFAFNCGLGELADSTLLTKFRAGDLQGAADEFPKWVHVHGQVEPGLVKRRAAERALFLSLPS